MSNLKTLSFFEIEQILSKDKKIRLVKFAQAGLIKSSKKTIEMLERLTHVPGNIDNLQKKIIWLQRKLYPNDKDDRNFRRAVKQAEELYYDFEAFEALQKKPNNLFLVLESLLYEPLDQQFESKLEELEHALTNDDHEHASNYLKYYLKEDLSHKFLSKRRKTNKYQFQQALGYLDQFYLIEKLKYGISYLQLTKIENGELPNSMRREIDLLSELHRDLINTTPILQIYHAIYLVYLEGEQAGKGSVLLHLLDRHSDKMKKSALKNLYNLVGNHLIGKITSVDLSISSLKSNYEEYFRFNQLLVREQLLHERDYIPHGRFQNVVASALNTGRLQDIAWAEEFLKEQLVSVHPDHRDDLENFCKCAICFYKKEYKKALGFLKRVRYGVNRFYYCDCKSLELRICYEYPPYDIDYIQVINSTVRAIRNDEKFADNHKKGYLHFFSFLRQLFTLKYDPTVKKGEIAVLKTKILKTHPIAQKKWLLEKIHELEEPYR